MVRPRPVAPLVRLRVDAPGQAAHHGDPRGRNLHGHAVGYGHTVVGWASRAHDRDRILLLQLSLDIQIQGIVGCRLQDRRVLLVAVGYDLDARCAGPFQFLYSKFAPFAARDGRDRFCGKTEALQVRFGCMQHLFRRPELLHKLSERDPADTDDAVQCYPEENVRAFLDGLAPETILAGAQG